MKVPTKTILFYLFISCILFLIASCSNDSETKSNQDLYDNQTTGPLALKLNWKNYGDDIDLPGSATRKACALVLNSDGTVNCQESNIATIFVNIYDQGNDNAFITNNGSGWDCEIHQAVLDDVLAGTGRKIVCIGKDSDGNVLYRGEKIDVTVIGGIAPTEAIPVSIDMNPFTTTLASVDDDNTSNIDTPTFQWEAIPNASSYQVQVSTDDDFSTIQFDEKPTTSEFITPAFSSSGDYFWRVRPIDIHGSEGAWSSVQPLNILLPPVSSINDASSVTATSANLSGTINPKGLVATCYFEYGKTTAYDSVTSFQNVGSGISDLKVNATISALDTQTTYHYHLVVKNSAGETISEDKSFTTDDITPPTVVSTEPVPNRKNAGVKTAISVTFSENIKKQEEPEKQKIIRVNDGLTDITGSIEYNGSIVTFTPHSDLSTDTTYTVEVTTDTIDLADNPLQSKVSWSFDTIETIPPEVLFTTPQGRIIKATFNEPVDPESINKSSFTVQTGGSFLNGEVRYNPYTNTASFMYVGDSSWSQIADTAECTATITTDVKDLAQNKMANDYSWNFTGRETYPRFTDMKDGTIRDNKTNLIWLKDANVFNSSYRWFDTIDELKSLHHGERGLTDGSVSGDWRLPTKEEWEAFVDANYNTPAVCNSTGDGQWEAGKPFNNIDQYDSFWSSTPEEEGCDPTGGYDACVMIWSVDIDTGILRATDNYCEWCSIWPVREPKRHRFKDMLDGTVFDNHTCLVWLKNANAFPPNEYNTANNLQNGEFGLTDGSISGDWRLPNKQEWDSFLDTNYQNPALCNTMGTQQWSQGNPFWGVLNYKYWVDYVDYSHGLCDQLAANVATGEIDFIMCGEACYDGVCGAQTWPVREFKHDVDDSDGDGVSGDQDICPNTPTGIQVDIYGCGDNDSDGDSVSDNQDNCPNTPIDEQANANGCSDSQIDTDFDGVTDDQDQCQNTANGVVVDTNGCQRFTDMGDGTVRDSHTGLRWLKNANCFGELTWADATNAVAELSNGDCNLSDGSTKGDWRLPTKDELQGIGTVPPTTWSSGTPPVFWFPPSLPLFENVQYHYPSSTEVDTPPSLWVWSVRMSDGNTGHINRETGDFVWPVRPEN